MTLQDCLRDRNRRQEVVNQRRVHISVNEDWLDKFISIKAQRERRHRVRVGNDSVEIEERWEIGGFCDCFWEVTWVSILILVLVLMLKMVVKDEGEEEEEQEEEQYEQKRFPPFWTK